MADDIFYNPPWMGVTGNTSPIRIRGSKSDVGAGMTTDYANDYGAVLSRRIPFLENQVGRMRAAGSQRRQLEELNRFLNKRGESTIDPLSELTPEQLDQEWVRWAGKGPKQASQAKIFQQFEAERKAEEYRAEGLSSMDQARRLLDAGPYGELLRFAKSQLENPELIDDEMQRLFKGSIRSEANRASRNFEERLRDDLAGRGLPGTPVMSGSGLRQLAGFESDLAGHTQESLRKAEIERVMANRDYQQSLMALTGSLAASDPRVSLLRARAGLEAAPPFTFGGEGFGDLGSVLAALETMDAASQQDFMDKYGGAIQAIVGAAGMVFAPATGGLSLVAAGGVNAGLGASSSNVTAKPVAAGKYPQSWGTSKVPMSYSTGWE